METTTMPTKDAVTRSIETEKNEVYKCDALDGLMRDSIYAMLDGAGNLNNGHAGSVEETGKVTSQIAIGLARHIRYDAMKNATLDGRIEKAVGRALGAAAIGNGILRVNQVADHSWKIKIAAIIAIASVAVTLVICGYGEVVAGWFSRTADKVQFAPVEAGQK